MEFPFGSAVVNVHAHATEDEQRVLSILQSLSLTETEIRKDSTKGHYGNPITVFEARLSQKKPIKGLWRKMLAGLQKESFAKLVAEIPDRVDESCFLYFRFDKQLAYNGDLSPTDSGDSVHLRFKIVTHPAERRAAIEKARNFLEVGVVDET